MRREIFSINTSLKRGNALVFLIENGSLQHVTLRFEVGIHAEPVILIDREELSVERGMMRFTERQHVR
jgi:hypothetical protein